MTAFFNRTAEFFWALLPQSRSMDMEAFAGEIIRGVEASCNPRERNTQERTSIRSFDTAFACSTKPVMGQLEPSGVKRMWRPPRSRDLDPI
jgi:hypothetical protein